MENPQKLNITETAVLEVVMQFFRGELQGGQLIQSNEPNAEGQYAYRLRGVSVEIDQKSIQVEVAFLASLGETALPAIDRESLSITLARAEA